jgi:uncharacterized protein YodC (DUF2158 family)
MKTNTYNVGDIVQLKSGGPKMTISTDADANGYYYAKWFAGSKLETGKFRAETLNIVQDDKPDKK